MSTGKNTGHLELFAEITSDMTEEEHALCLSSFSALLINQIASVLKLHAYNESIDSIDIGEGVG